jgi:hypothetical protein
MSPLSIRDFSPKVLSGIRWMPPLRRLNMAEMTVRIEGTVPTTPSGTQTVAGTVTANQGTAAVTASAWPIKVTDGTNTASIAVPGSGGSSLLVSTGTSAALTTLTAATTGNGTSYDLGAAKANISLAVVVNGTVTSGTVRLEGSHNGTDWILLATSATLATGVNQDVTKSGVAYRFARGAVGTAVGGGGSVTVTVAAS